jgi:uncharacterized protein YidB (DUF937 family)
VGLFDEIMGQVAGPGGPAGAPANVAQALLGMLSEGRAGGLAGLLQGFEQGGLGHLVASWVGGGQNLPVTADQVQGALGADRIQELAQRAGIPPGEASQAIAAVLPAVVDRLTPNGRLDSGLLEEGLGMFRKFL